MFQPLPPPGPATAELSTGWSGALTLPVCDRCKRICVQAMRANSTMAAAITIAVVVRCSASLDGARGADVGVALPMCHKLTVPPAQTSVPGRCGGHPSKERLWRFLCGYTPPRCASATVLRARTNNDNPREREGQSLACPELLRGLRQSPLARPSDGSAKRDTVQTASPDTL